MDSRCIVMEGSLKNCHGEREQVEAEGIGLPGGIKKAKIYELSGRSKFALCCFDEFLHRGSPLVESRTDFMRSDGRKAII